jgi:hypothetical protein
MNLTVLGIGIENPALRRIGRALGHALGKIVAFLGAQALSSASSAVVAACVGRHP